MSSTAIGVDFGGTGIKGALVDLDRGAFAGERVRIDTPEDSTPGNVIPLIRDLVDRLDDGPGATGPVGITIPGVVHNGRVRSAGNIDPAWFEIDADAELTRALGRDVHLVNDADAAGFAEARYGAAKGHDGLVVMTTLGTGIGSALIYRGVLIPSAELGHLELDGQIAEKRAANSAREAEGLSWEEWAARLSRYYQHLDRLLTPDLFVVGGGVSKKAERFLPLVECDVELVPAALLNAAGIVGAALWAAEAGSE